MTDIPFAVSIQNKLYNERIKNYAVRVDRLF